MPKSFKCWYTPTKSILIEMLCEPCCFSIQQINPQPFTFIHVVRKFFTRKIQQIPFSLVDSPHFARNLFVDCRQCIPKSKKNALEFRWKSLIQCANLGDCEMEGAEFIFDTIQTFQFAHGIEREVKESAAQK